MTYKIVMIFAQVGYVWWPRAAMVKKKKQTEKVVCVLEKFCI